MNGPDLLLSYTVFCLIMATTPGPNNMMVLASGVRFGTRRTLPLIFGIAGTVATWGDPLFARDDVWVLGLRTNLAFSISSIVYGGLILIGAIIGGRAGHLANLTIAVVFMVTGLLMMALLQTDANFLNFSMSTVIVSLIFGLIFLATGAPERMAQTPDVPTFGELGADLELAVTRGIVMPKGSPQEARDTLEAALSELAKDETFVQQVNNAGAEVQFRGQDDYVAYLTKLSETVDRLAEVLAP